MKTINKLGKKLIAGLMMLAMVLVVLAPNAGALSLGMNLITTGPVPPGTGGNAGSERPSISADGTKIVFSSVAADLIPGLTPTGPWQIYLYDTVTATTKLITAGPLGEGGDASSYYPAISADGSKITFVSNASDLIPGKTIDTNQYYIYDVATGITTLITAGPTGTGADGWTWGSASISANGSKVAFNSDASNLVGANTDGFYANIFLYDVATATTTLITKGLGLLGGDNSSTLPTISADGTRIVFTSTATDLISGFTTNDNFNVYLYNVTTGTTSLITKGPSPYIGSDDINRSYATDISADNNLIVFSSIATDLIDGITANRNQNIFLYNVTTGVTTLVTAGPSGVGGDYNSFSPSISANGSVIGFSSIATDLIDGTTTGGGGVQNVYIYDVATGLIELITKGSSGTGGVYGSNRPTFSASGCTLTFHSYATDLIAGKTIIGHGDIFAYSRCAEPTPPTPPTVNPPASGINGTQTANWATYAVLSAVAAIALAGVMLVVVNRK